MILNKTFSLFKFIYKQILARQQSRRNISKIK